MIVRHHKNSVSPRAAALVRGNLDGRSISLARFHDGAAKSNWGGRATSLALAGVLANIPAVESVAPINGTFITEGFGDFRWADKARVRVVHYARRAVGARRTPIETRPFAQVEEFASRLLSDPPNAAALELVRRIESEDELWMNGEGDFILGYSGTLWRTLLIMSIAQQIGKPTFLVNSILSEPASGRIAPAVREGVARIIEKCNGVVYRDPRSLELSEELFPSVAASWAPDALFAWADLPSIAPREMQYSNSTEGIPLDVQALMAQGSKIAAISGSSVLRSWTPSREAHMRILVEGLREAGLHPVFVATSDEDEWWATSASRMSAPFVQSRIPLTSGMTLLAASDVFVSGRYHPSILAACVGTPIVTFGSNSHKTASLYRVLGDVDASSFPSLDVDPRSSGLLDRVIGVSAESTQRRPAMRTAAKEAAGRMRGVLADVAA